MKVLVQWTGRNPTDWVEIASADWGRIPDRPEPAPSEIGGRDDLPGHVFKLNVQGVTFEGDHYAVEGLPGGACRVTAWNDDPDDYPAGMRSARVWTFEPIQPDPALGGALNTRQTKTVYVEDDIRRSYERAGWDAAELRPWSEFVAPPPRLTRHGVWVSDAAHDRHEAARSLRGWREWTEGIGDADLHGGRIIPQRTLKRYSVPDGTITYYQRDTDQATGVHATEDAALENLLSDTAGAGEAESDTLVGGDEVLLFCFTTASGAPGDAAWPTGNYRCQLDVSTAGADLTYGLRAAGAAVGHFARVNSGLTSDLETKAQTEALFSGTGLKLATTGSVSWTAGATGDRYECLVACARAANHGNQTLELTYDADAFADGPWTPSATPVTAAITAGGSVAHNLKVSKSAAISAGGSVVASKAALFKQIAAIAAGGTVATSFFKFSQIAANIVAGGTVTVAKTVKKLSSIAAGGTVAVNKAISKSSAIAAGGSVASSLRSVILIASDILAGPIALADSYSESNADDSFPLSRFDPEGGISFLGNGGVLKRMTFYLSSADAPSGDMVARLYAHTGTFGVNGTPTGAALEISTSAANASILNASPQLVSFDFDASRVLVDGTAYFAIVAIDEAGIDEINIHGDSSAPSHEGNSSYFTDGGGWNLESQDFVFYVHTSGLSIAKKISKSASIVAGAAVSATRAVTFRRSANITAGGTVSSSLRTVAQIAANIGASAAIAASNVFQGGGGPVRIVRQIWGTVRGMVLGIVRTVFDRDRDDNVED